MPLVINMLPHQGPAQGNKEIVMGKKEVADYYPPGATEPIVRPADVPAPEEVQEVEAPSEEVPKAPAAPMPKKAVKIAKKK